MEWTEEQIIVMIADAQEGNLSETQKKLLYEFIAENPQFSDYLEDLPVLTQDNSYYSKKTDLLKDQKYEISAYASLGDSFDDKLIVADMEGLLTEYEKQLLQVKLKSDEFLVLQREYFATRLNADNTIVYNNKKHLLQTKSKMTPMRILWLSMGAAAVGVLFYFSGLNVEGNKTVLVQNKDSIYTRKTQIESSVKRNQEKEKHRALTSAIKHKNDTVYIPLEISEKPKNTALIARLETVKLKKINILHDEAKIEAPQKLNFIPSAIQKTESYSKEYATVGDLLIKKLKKVVFGNEEIDNQEQLTMITQKINHQTGLDIAYLRNEKVDESGFYFKLGAISVERKKANL
jgi:hypothetical protein